MCLSTDLGYEAVSGRATLYSYTVVDQAFHAYYAAMVPYVLATVELEEQAKLMFFSRLVDCSESELRIGLPVVVAFDDVTPSLTLPLFTPSQDSSSEGTRS